MTWTFQGPPLLIVSVAESADYWLSRIVLGCAVLRHYKTVGHDPQACLKWVSAYATVLAEVELALVARACKPAGGLRRVAINALQQV
jgi:hypothetical protein